MRRLAIGDIHGGYRAMLQVLERAQFNKEEDMLIGIGDYADGWPDVFECVEYLSALKNFVGVLGNHDEWLLENLLYGRRDRNWLYNGGGTSLDSYAKHDNPERALAHAEFLQKLPFYLELDDKLFVHGGVAFDNFGELFPIRDQWKQTLTWDRYLFIAVASSYKLGRPFILNIAPHKEIYIGHTTTQAVQPDLSPVFHEGVYLLDQGGGWSGKLTVVDIDTKEFWQSDHVPDLYPEVEGRK